MDRDGEKANLDYAEARSSAQRMRERKKEPVANRICGRAVDRSSERGDFTKLYTPIAIERWRFV